MSKATSRASLPGRVSGQLISAMNGVLRRRGPRRSTSLTGASDVDVSVAQCAASD
jgi:hypothetical protein